MFKYIKDGQIRLQTSTQHIQHKILQKDLFLHFVYIQLKDWCNCSISSIRLPHLFKVKSEDSTRTWGENKTKQTAKQTNHHTKPTNQKQTQNTSHSDKKKNHWI